MIIMSNYIICFLTLILLGQLAHTYDNLRSTYTCPNPGSANTNRLGAAANYAMFSSSSVTFTGANTVVGNIGIAPGALPVPNPQIGGTQPTFTCGVVDYNNLNAQNAHTACLNSYTNLMALTPTGTTVLTADFAGLNITPGIYHWGAAASCSGAFTLDAGTNKSAEWIFQIVGAFTTSANAKVTVINGSNFNVYWVMDGAFNPASGTDWVGNIVANGAIGFGAGCTFTGRALACPGAVTFDTSSVSSISCG